MKNQDELRITKALESLKGVIKLKLLNTNERNGILEVEKREEEKIVWGMCRSINQGVREAVDREFTVAMVIDSARFEYPYHPHMTIRYRDVVVGEEVSEERASELKKEKTNIFLGDKFVVYFHRIPREPEAREELRLHYLARPFNVLGGTATACDCVLGVPSVEGDAKLKEILKVQRTEPEIGTCLIGYNLCG